LAKEGRIALLIGSSQIQTAKSALGGVEWQDPLSLPLSQSRSLIVGRATA
jgi:hypothetical protein